MHRDAQRVAALCKLRAAIGGRASGNDAANSKEDFFHGGSIQAPLA
jgi:hypothetical protein